MGKAVEKRTRNPELTRARILEVAFMEIFVNGFQAASVNNILDKTNLTKGAFFHHFPTKQDLGYALVDETLREMVLDRWIRPLEDYENPLEGIIVNLRKIIDSTEEKHLALGCPLNNLVQEMSPIDPIFKKKLAEVLEVWVGGIEKYLKKAQVRGYLNKESNPRRLAEFIVMNHEGAFGMTKSTCDRKVFRSLHASLKDYLQTLTPN
ncbi:MAG: TetR/AcrR family transcriptional regulator [Bdellovibrionota bacterium]